MERGLKKINIAAVKGRHAGDNGKFGGGKSNRQKQGAEQSVIDFAEEKELCEAEIKNSAGNNIYDGRIKKEENDKHGGIHCDTDKSGNGRLFLG